MTVKVTPPHGTRARYEHRDPSIRCTAGSPCPHSPTCAEAHNAYMRDYMRARRRLAATYTSRSSEAAR